MYHGLKSVGTICYRAYGSRSSGCGGKSNELKRTLQYLNLNVEEDAVIKIPHSDPGSPMLFSAYLQYLYLHLYVVIYSTKLPGARSPDSDKRFILLRRLLLCELGIKDTAGAGKAGIK